MKVGMLGVYNAFGVGDYLDSIPIKDLLPLIEELSDVKNFELFKSEIQKKTISLYNPKWQSNFLLEFDSPGKLGRPTTIGGFDYGGDIRHSSWWFGKKMGDYDWWYTSHPHNDHIGGVEGIALSTFFNPFWNKQKIEWLKKMGTNDVKEAYKRNNFQMPNDCKPTIYAHEEVMDEVWEAAAPGLRTIEGVPKVKLSTYFELAPMKTNFSKKIQDGNRYWEIYTIESTHVVSGYGHMPTYGLYFRSSDNFKIYFPSDSLLYVPPTMESFFREMDVIYVDCETGVKTGVHAHIEEIEKADPEIKKKCYLYHYTTIPDVDESKYKGFLRQRDVHVY